MSRLPRDQVFTDLEHLDQQVLHLEIHRGGFDWRDVRCTGKSRAELRAVLLFRDGRGVGCGVLADAGWRWASIREAMAFFVFLQSRPVLHAPLSIFVARFLYL